LSTASEFSPLTEVADFYPEALGLRIATNRLLKADCSSGSVPKNITPTNPDSGSTCICMPVFPSSLLFKLAPGHFSEEKLPTVPEPFQKLPTKVNFFRVLTMKPHDHQISFH
jgi:hypothetical protein